MEEIKTKNPSLSSFHYFYQLPLPCLSPRARRCSTHIHIHVGLRTLGSTTNGEDEMKCSSTTWIKKQNAQKVDNPITPFSSWTYNKHITLILFCGRGGYWGYIKGDLGNMFHIIHQLTRMARSSTQGRGRNPSEWRYGRSEWHQQNANSLSSEPTM